MFKQFLILVNNLPSGTVFFIEAPWLNANGIKASATDAKKMGSEFAKIYAKYNCICLGKRSDNHTIYKKI